jgi:hypothetical protein
VRLPQQLLVLVLFLGASGLGAQTDALPPLGFLGFQPGQSLEGVAHQVEALGGKRLRCDRAKRDHSITECRALVVEPESGLSVNLWLSAVDSSTSVLTLSAEMNGIELDAWRSRLEHNFGVVNGTVQGPQWMLQWVRRGRMLRLTWRIEQGKKTASVSLIDGKLLDEWGRRPARWRRSPPAPRDTAPDSAAHR